MEATRGTVVSLNYTLTDDDGTVLDTSEGCAPLTYLHGYENIISGLESALEGVEVGHKSEVVVEAADAYGEVAEGRVFAVARDQFPPDVPVAPGMTFAGETADGDVPLMVIEVNDDRVMVDANHPLAGMRLHFDVEVVEVRAASGEELRLGQPQ